MAFTDAIAVVMADLTQNVAPGMGITQPIVWRIGAKWLGNRIDAPPRIIWVPRSEVPGTLKNLGASPARQLMARRVTFQTYLYAAPLSSDDAVDVDIVLPADTLLSALLAAMYRVTYGTFFRGPAQWSSQGGTINFYGATVTQEIGFDIPVIDLPWSTHVGTSDQITPNPSS